MMRLLLLAISMHVCGAVGEPTFKEGPVVIDGGQSANGAMSLHRTNQRRVNKAQETTDDASLTCQVVEARVMYKKGTEEDQTRGDVVYKCITTPDEEVDGANGMMYKIPDELVKSIKTKMVGNIFPKVKIHGAKSRRSSSNEDDVIVASPSAIVEVLSAERSLRSAFSFGTRTVLVVRVSSLDSSCTLTASTISSRVFGPIGLSFSSVYSDCSWNALTMVPATGPGIVNGVTDVFIDQNTIGVDPSSFENAVTAVAENQIDGFHDIGHVIYCMPATTLNWLAYGYINYGRAVFNDEWCGSPSALVHEIGHNLGLEHSGAFGSEYGDETDMMGFSESYVDGPAKCFNAHKHWVLGWYESRSISVDLRGGPWAGSVVAFTDYDQAGKGEYVIINVNSLYIQYNKAEEFNAETRLLPNQLVIVQAQNDDSKSDLVGGLESVPGAIIRVEADGEPDLLIIVCSTSEVGDKSIMAISIYLETQSAQCGSRSTPKPTSRPTLRRTRKPTPKPTTRTTPKPTSKPPTRRTRNPTSRPSSAAVESPDFSLREVNNVCDDNSEGLFFAPNVNRKVHCAWLKTRPNVRKRMCSEDDPSGARWICMETCGLCSDECLDSDVNRFLDNFGEQRTCLWLERNPRFHNILCQPGTEAYATCPETCNACDGIPSEAASSFDASSISLSTSAATSTELTTTVMCDDSRDDMFLVDNKFERCVWLAVRPELHPSFCHEDHPSQARDVCPKTCGKCKDECRDDLTFNFVDRGSKRDCTWLSLRSLEQTRICTPGHEAYTRCQEACNVCDGRISS